MAMIERKQKRIGKYFQIKLEKHLGCIGCKIRCEFNAPVVSKQVALQSKGLRFKCNSLEIMRQDNEKIKN